jgi:hypothetical protein
MNQNDRVYLVERCRCQREAVCFHKQPLVVLRQFKTTGKLLVDNGHYVCVVDFDKVTGAQP